MNENELGEDERKDIGKICLTKCLSDLSTWKHCRDGHISTEYHCRGVGVMESWNRVYRMSNVSWPASYLFDLSLSFLEISHKSQ
jgi:hypothetical protein